MLDYKKDLATYVAPICLFIYFFDEFFIVSFIF